MPNFAFLSEKYKARYFDLVDPLADFMVRMRVTPNALTVMGFCLSGVAGLIYSSGAFFWAGWVLLFAGACDSLDGVLARKRNMASRFGAFLDSALDRFGEIFIFTGLVWHFSGGAGFINNGGVEPSEVQSPLAVLFIVLAMAGSLMVSYTRARAEGLGLKCKVGWVQRPERIILLIIGSWLGGLPVIGHVVMTFTFIVLAVLSNATAVQRILYVRKKLLEEDQSSTGSSN